MGNNECKVCEPDRTPQYLAQYSNYRTINQLTEKYNAYKTRNMLEFYDQRIQMNVQRLFCLNQQHVADLILRLSEEKKYNLRDKVLDDIESIDLEQLDHLCIMKKISKYLPNIQSFTSFTFEQVKKRKTYIKTSKSYFKLHDLPKTNDQQILKIINKNSLIEKMPTQKVSNIINCERFLIIASVGCFQQQNALNHSKLPSKKSLLTLFLQKIQGVNKKYQHTIFVAFIVNPEYQRAFDKQIFLFLCKLDQQNEKKYGFHPFKYEKIIYKPCYPCVNHERKIIINSQQIVYNYTSGDLIGFLSKNKRMQQLTQFYQFVQIANVSNIMQTIADKQILTLLLQNECDIIANISTKSKENHDQMMDTLNINKFFIEKSLNKSNKQPSYKLAQSFYIRASLFYQRAVYFQNTLSKRIKSELISEEKKIFHFVRTFQDILYAPITILTLIPENQSYQPYRQEVVFSNYCKQILGIQNINEYHLIQVNPQIIYGDQKIIIQTRQRLKKLQKFKYPIIVDKKNIQTGQQKLKK